MSNAIWIDSELHKAVKRHAFNQGIGIGELTEGLLANYLNTAPAPSNEESKTVINIVKKPVGAPSRKISSFVRCNDEIKIMQSQAIPDRLPEEEAGIIKIEIEKRGAFFEGMNQQTNILICLAMAKEEGNLLSPDKLDYIAAFNGMPDCIEVKQDNGVYGAGNKLADMILALQPGRMAFDKYALYYLKTFGDFTIKYLD